MEGFRAPAKSSESGCPNSFVAPFNPVPDSPTYEHQIAEARVSKGFHRFDSLVLRVAVNDHGGVSIGQELLKSLGKQAERNRDGSIDVPKRASKLLSRTNVEYDDGAAVEHELVGDRRHHLCPRSPFGPDPERATTDERGDHQTKKNMRAFTHRFSQDLEFELCPNLPNLPARDIEESGVEVRSELALGELDSQKPQQA